MANIKLLNMIIAKSGIKLNHIATECHECRQTLWSRLNNKSEFTKFEIETISRVLHLSPELKKIIFYEDSN